MMTDHSLIELLNIAASEEQRSALDRAEQLLKQAVDIAIKNTDKHHLLLAYGRYVAFLRRQRRETDAIATERLMEVCFSQALE